MALPTLAERRRPGHKPDGLGQIGLRRGTCPAASKGGEGPRSQGASSRRGKVMAAALAGTAVGLPRGASAENSLVLASMKLPRPITSLTGVAGHGRGAAIEVGAHRRAGLEGPADGLKRPLPRRSARWITSLRSHSHQGLAGVAKRGEHAPPTQFSALIKRLGHHLRRQEEALGTAGGRDQNRCRPPGRCRGVRRQQGLPSTSSAAAGHVAAGGGPGFAGIS